MQNLPVIADSWSKEFDELFVDYRSDYKGHMSDGFSEDVKDFIRALLTAAEERAVREHDAKWHPIVDGKMQAEHTYSQARYQNDVDEAYRRGLAEMKERAVNALQNMAIEVVGNSAKTADQAIHTVRSLEVPREEI